MNILRPKDTARKCGVTTVTVHRWSSDPKYAHLNFPKLIPLGDNSVGFVEAEIDAWLEARAAARDDAATHPVDREDANALAAKSEDAEARDAQASAAEREAVA